MYSMPGLKMYDSIIYVEPDRQNKPDAERQIFEIEDGTITETIKWCRRNFGERGDGWDFHGRYGKKCAIEIWSHRLIVMWKIWKE
jgi:hypothetical protein